MYDKEILAKRVTSLGVVGCISQHRTLLATGRVRFVLAVPDEQK